MNRSIAAVSLILALASPAFAARYVCFGDSNTAGAGRRSTDTYLGPLGAFLSANVGPTTMVNEGFGGEITAVGRTRLTRVGIGAGDYVLIMEGTNDVQRWPQGTVTRSQTRANLAAMVQTVLARGGIPVLATVVPRVGDSVDPSNALTRQLNSDIRQIAGSVAGVLLADVFASVEPLASAFIYNDSLHPNVLGYDLVAEAFAIVISGRPPADVDLTPPLPITLIPFPGSRSNGLNSSIEIAVVEPKHPFDPVNAVFNVDGAAVIPQVDTTSRPGQTRFLYQFPQPLRFGQSVSVSFRIADLSVPANELALDYSWSTSAGNGTNGDVNQSGRIDGADLAVLAGSFGARTRDSRYVYAADIDASGTIDGLDLSLLAAGFGGAP